MSYTTTPGTIPHRVVELLNKLQPGAEKSNAELAELLGLTDNNLGPYLTAPRKHGALRATKRGNLIFWSLGDGVPLADAEPDEAPLAQRVVPAANAAPLSIPVFAKLPAPVDLSIRSDVDGAPALPPAVVAELSKPAQAVAKTAAAPAPLRLALWSDGALVIERGGESVQFDAGETRQIVAYLERQREAA